MGGHEFVRLALKETTDKVQDFCDRVVPGWHHFAEIMLWRLCRSSSPIHVL